MQATENISCSGFEITVECSWKITFTSATLCVSVVFTVRRWLSVFLSVCHTPALCLNG